MTVFDPEKVPHVFINEELHKDGDRLDDYEFLDSLVHEMTHATGPILGRWNIDQQPNLSTIDESTVLSYAIEEFIAITTASKIVSDIFGIPGDESKQMRSAVIQHETDRLQLPPEKLATIDWNYVESSSQQAFDFLCDGAGSRSIRE